MLRYHSSSRRKILDRVRLKLHNEIPKQILGTYNLESFKSFIGITQEEYIEYITDSAQRAGAQIDQVGLVWTIRIPIAQPIAQMTQPHTDLDLKELYCKQTHFSNHSIEWSQAYCRTLAPNNPVLVSLTNALINKMVQAKLLNRKRAGKIKCFYIESVLLFMLNEKFTKENRELIRFCMTSQSMPFAREGDSGIYRNCMISLPKIS